MLRLDTCDASPGCGGAEPPKHLYIVPGMCGARSVEPRPRIGESIEFYEYTLTKKVTLDATGAIAAKTEVPFVVPGP